MPIKVLSPHTSGCLTVIEPNLRSSSSTCVTSSARPCIEGGCGSSWLFLRKKVMMSPRNWGASQTNRIAATAKMTDTHGQPCSILPDRSPDFLVNWTPPKRLPPRGAGTALFVLPNAMCLPPKLVGLDALEIGVRGAPHQSSLIPRCKLCRLGRIPTSHTKKGAASELGPMLKRRAGIHRWHPRLPCRRTPARFARSARPEAMPSSPRILGQWRPTFAGRAASDLIV